MSGFSFPAGGPQTSLECLKQSPSVGRRFSVTLSGFALLLFLYCLTASAQTFTKLVDFNFVDGAGPLGPMVQGSDGNLYGSTVEGGTGGLGTVFKIGLDGGLVKLHDFCAVGLCDGMFVQGVVFGKDGNLYGTASTGGVSNDGTVFQVTTAGVVTVLHSFNLTDGMFPGRLTVGNDGNFYGTATNGGAHSGGVIYKISPTGQFRVLHDFCAQSNCSDGGATSEPLVQARDGNFYGISMMGGPMGGGVIFKITRNGTYSVVYNFCSLSHCADGRWPLGGLTQGRDGNLYGVTFQGGGGKCFRGCGTMFKITLAGALTTLHRFTQTDFSVPDRLLLATDGNFYTTSEVPGTDITMIVKVTPSGTFTSLYTMTESDGEVAGSLMQANDGNLYGGATLGGLDFDAGTLFRFSLGSDGASETGTSQ